VPNTNLREIRLVETDGASKAKVQIQAARAIYEAEVAEAHSLYQSEMRHIDGIHQDRMKEAREAAERGSIETLRGIEYEQEEFLSRRRGLAAAKRDERLQAAAAKRDAAIGIALAAADDGSGAEMVERVRRLRELIIRRELEDVSQQIEEELAALPVDTEQRLRVLMAESDEAKEQLHATPGPADEDEARYHETITLEQAGASYREKGAQIEQLLTELERGPSAPAVDEVRALVDSFLSVELDEMSKLRELATSVRESNVTYEFVRELVAQLQCRGTAARSSAAAGLMNFFQRTSCEDPEIAAAVNLAALALAKAALTDTYIGVRNNAVYAFQELGPAAASAIPFLQRVIETGGDSLLEACRRKDAIILLGHIGAGAEGIIERVLEERDPKSLEGQAARHVLQNIRAALADQPTADRPEKGRGGGPLGYPGEFWAQVLADSGDPAQATGGSSSPGIPKATHASDMSREEIRRGRRGRRFRLEAIAQAKLAAFREMMRQEPGGRGKNWRKRAVEAIERLEETSPIQAIPAMLDDPEILAQAP